jgi:DNA phosphorothioation-dependent restriction protein DptG
VSSFFWSNKLGDVSEPFPIAIDVLLGGVVISSVASFAVNFDETMVVDSVDRLVVGSEKLLINGL